MSLTNTIARLIPLIDLTSLNESDTEATIENLCREAVTPYGSAAAVCIYPQFVKQAKSYLSETSVSVATVVNFPRGDESLSDCVSDIKTVLQNGADEIDVVMPYHTYLNGDTDDVLEFLQACRGICGSKIIYKVILETGALINSDVIAGATDLAIQAGADFIKTSTGKINAGATPVAVEMILERIKHFPHKKIGLKISGGIRNAEQALSYVRLIENKMGKNWITPRTLRFGASQLLNDILQKV